MTTTATRIALLTLAVSTSLFAATPTTPSAPAASTPPDIGPPTAIWRDPSKTPDQRARDILPRLTLEEKIALLHADGTFTSAGLPRFNIPKMWMSDGPNGVREEIQPSGWNVANRTDDFTTAMPADISLAASFDTDLGRAYGSVIGEEALTRGKNIMLCPGLNIMRTPLNGRNSEYLGEDPYLSSRMAVGFITGLQSHGVAACAKHYALNNQENNRGSVNVHVDERTMREIYLPAFKAAVTEAHAWAVMSAYNRVNGDYCSENDFLLNQVLKKDWAFQGLVMTDWGGAHSTVKAAKNGLDLEMGTNVTGNHNNDFFAAPLLQAVGDGPNKVPLALIDDKALRNLRVMAATGIFDASNMDKDQKKIPLMSEAHIATARRVAESGTVLLKNTDNLLPIDTKTTKSIAIIGDIAKAKFAHDGNSAAIKTSYEITPFDGISKRAGAGVTITYAQGYTRPAAGGRGGRGAPGGAGAGGADPNQLIVDARNAAQNADIAVIVAGLYRGQDQEGADRPSFSLPPNQAELIQSVCEGNPRTIVILTGGSPSSVDPWIDTASALLMYWYGGTEGGTALANILFGDVNPSGHLPCTWPKKLADSPAHSFNDPAVFPGTGGGRGAIGGGGRGPGGAGGVPEETYKEELLVGYRWYDAKKIEPQFPFGFGLSYTTFAFADLQQAKVERAAGDNSVATFVTSITNTGTREGSTVAYAFVSQDNPTVPRPPKELKAFQKVSLKPAEKKQVALSLPPSAFTHYDVDKHAWIAEPGTYTILIGDSAANTPLKTTFTLSQPITIKEGQ
ncbi:MAG TPA: glycoside hydrolase family 3 C-terminal domain-containing protein [Phycisphaerae bacterium]|jgi:beta-glucosidase